MEKRKLILIITGAILVIGAVVLLLFLQLWSTDEPVDINHTPETNDNVVTINVIGSSPEADETPRSDVTVPGRGNTPGNITNLGYIVETEDWLYIASPNGMMPLYRERYDGSERHEVNPEERGFTYINIVGDWIYYSNMTGDPGRNIYRIRTDGTGKEKLNDDNSSWLSVVDGWIYYVNNDDDFSLYRIRTDGYGREKISDSQIRTFNAMDEWVYYSVKDEAGIYRVNMDGSNRISICDERADILIIEDGWIYFLVLIDTPFINKLHKMRLDGSECERIAEDDVWFFNISNGWIYYGNNSDERYLYRIRTDGTERGLVYADKTETIYIVGEWVYFSQIASRPPMYRVRTDGLEHENLMN